MDIEGTAVIPAIDTGAGGAGGAGGGEGGGAPADVEEVLPGQGGEGGGEGGAGEGGEERLPGDRSDDTHPEREDVEADSRIIDGKTKAALAKLEALGPEGKEAAKAVREAYFANKTVMKEYPEAKNFREVIRSIRTQKATLEAVGGDEGIQNLQTEVADYQKEIGQFANGDRALVEQLYEGNPQSTMLAARNCLEVLAEKNLTLLDQAILPNMISRLQAAQLPQFLKAIAQHCIDGKGQEAYDLTQKISTWLSELEKHVEGINKDRTKVDPREQELSKREQAAEQKETQIYERQISNNVTKLNNVSLDKVTRGFFKEMGFDGEGRREFTQGLINRVTKAMALDKPFQRLARSIMSKGDAERASEFISDKFEELLPDIFRTYRNTLYPKMASKPSANGTGGKPGAGAGKDKPAAGAGGGGNPQATLVTKKPGSAEIDWEKTTEEMYHVGRGFGEAILTNGKRVKWDWTTV